MALALYTLCAWMIHHTSHHGTFIPSALPTFFLISDCPLTLKVMRSYILTVRIWLEVRLFLRQGRRGVGLERPRQRYRSLPETSNPLESVLVGLGHWLCFISNPPP